MEEWIRHGDVVLKKVSNVKGKQHLKKDLVLAEGEVTGHFHTLKGQCLESVYADERFIELEQDLELEHREHDTLNVPKGKYQVLLQREVDMLGEVRQVMD